jgi:hypothetical protein
LVLGGTVDQKAHWGLAPVGLWSRSRRTLVWKSPQFLRVDVVRRWPARNTKTAAVSGAILRHLREIMLPEAQLTKPVAQKQCMAEVPNAYPAAFNKAWAALDRLSKEDAVNTVREYIDILEKLRTKPLAKKSI